MTVSLMAAAQSKKSLDAFCARLSYSDQYAGGEGNRRLSRRVDRFEAYGGSLVRLAEMCVAALAKPVGGAFEHDPHGRRYIAQRHKLLARHHTGI